MDDLQKRAAIGYVRASTDEQPTTLRDQEERIQAYCAAYRLDLTEVIIDAGVSGKVPISERPNGRRLVPLFEQKQPGQRKKRKLNGTTVVITKLDRLGRNAYDAMGIARGAAYQGVHLVALDDHIDLTMPSGRFAFKIMVAAAEYEREVIGERISGHHQAKRSRHEITGQVPYGWDRSPDPDVKVLTPNLEELDRAGQMATWRADGWTFQRIADEANARCWPTKTGTGRWYPNGVSLVVARQQELTA